MSADEESIVLCDTMMNSLKVLALDDSEARRGEEGGSDIEPLKGI